MWIAARSYRLRILVVGSILAASLVGCSSLGSGAPTADPRVQPYVSLVHRYWIQYKTAEGNPNHFIDVCLGLVQNPDRVDPAACQAIGIAIIPPHESFLTDLDRTPPPARFKTDDQAFRAQLPLAIADLKAMVAAAVAGDRVAVIQHMKAYSADMIPRVTHALDDVDPSVVHD